MNNDNYNIELDIVITPEGTLQDKIFSITSLQIPNVVTQGNTIEEAKKRLKEALQLYLEERPEEKEKIIKSSREKNLPLITRMML